MNTIETFATETYVLLSRDVLLQTMRRVRLASDTIPGHNWTVKAIDPAAAPVMVTVSDGWVDGTEKTVPWTEISRQGVTPGSGTMFPPEAEAWLRAHPEF